MSLLKTNEIQVFNGTTVTITATTAEVSADLNVGADLDVTGALTLGTALAIAEGGTGATDAATARTNLDVDQAGTDNSTDVTLVTTSHDYLSITDQAITLGPIDLATDVTGTLAASNGGTGVTSLGSLNAADLGSGAATDGYVLTADGAGGSAWEAASGGAASLPIDLLSSGASIRKSDGTTAVLSESGGTVTLENTSLGDTVLMPDNSNNVSTAPGIRFEADTDTGIGLASAGNLAVVTGGTERMRVDSSGNVGIGTTSPSHKLDVAGNFAVSQGSRIYLTNNTGFSPHITNTADANSMQFFTYNIERVRIDSSGNVDIANLGTGTVYSNGGVLTNTNPSDINLKENVVPIQYGLDSVKQLNPIEFDWIADETDKHEFGFIAQEVQQVIPDLVSTYEYTDEETQVTETRLGLESTQFIPVLVKALQEANAKIDALTARIEALEV